MMVLSVVGRLLPLRRLEGTIAEMSDEALLAACAKSDPAALGALFDRFNQAVYHFLMRYLGPAHPEIDDLVQATFIEVRRSAASYRGSSSVRSWMLGIAANLGRHHLRAQTRRRNMLTGAAKSPPSGGGAGPDAAAERRQLLARLREAITELPEDLRGPLVLCDMEELPGAEAARALGLREGTLWRRLHEARKLLRVTLERSLR